MEHLDVRVAQHYTTPDLIGRIDAALAEAGVTTLTIDALKPVDEFHTGGLEATDALLSQLQIGPNTRVLDLGAGLGGTARHIVHRYGAHVTGVDVTPCFVEAARHLNDRLELGDAITMMEGSALDLPIPGGSVDLVTMFHVGMNIEDKPALMAEVARVLTPGGTFAIFDVMRAGLETELLFPVPWSATPDTSFVDHPLAYETAAEGAGLTVVGHRNRAAFALEFFAHVFDHVEAHGLPPLGIHLLMGDTAGEKLRNYVANVEAGRIAPVELILRKPQ